MKKRIAILRSITFFVILLTTIFIPEGMGKLSDKLILRVNAEDDSSYTVTFHSEEGYLYESLDNYNGKDYTVKVSRGSSITTYPGFKRDGFTIKGWKIQSDTSDTLYVTGIKRNGDNEHFLNQYKPDRDITFIAQWVEAYKVTYHIHNEEQLGEPEPGTATIGDHSYYVEKDTAISELEFPGVYSSGRNILIGWKVDGDDTLYVTKMDNAEGNKLLWDYVVTKDTTFVAQYVKGHAVAFHSDEGYLYQPRADRTDYITYVKPGSGIINVPVGNREGYILSGWKIQGDESNTIYGTDYEDINKYIPDKDVTFIAQWDKAYTVQFYSEYGDEGDIVQDIVYSVDVKAGGNISYLPNLYHERYMVRGWKIENDDTLYTNGEKDIEDSTDIFKYAIDKDVTFIAQWEEKKPIENISIVKTESGMDISFDNVNGATEYMVECYAYDGDEEIPNEEEWSELDEDGDRIQGLYRWDYVADTFKRETDRAHYTFVIKAYDDDDSVIATAEISSQDISIKKSGKPFWAFEKENDIYTVNIGSEPNYEMGYGQQYYIIDGNEEKLFLVNESVATITKIAVEDNNKALVVKEDGLFGVVPLKPGSTKVTISYLPESSSEEKTYMYTLIIPDHYEYLLIEPSKASADAYFRGNYQYMVWGESYTYELKSILYQYDEKSGHMIANERPSDSSLSYKWNIQSGNQKDGGESGFKIETDGPICTITAVKNDELLISATKISNTGDENKEQASGNVIIVDSVESTYRIMPHPLLDHKPKVGEEVKIEPQLWYYEAGKEPVQVTDQVLYNISYDNQSVTVKDLKGETIENESDVDTGFSIVRNTETEPYVYIRAKINGELTLGFVFLDFSDEGIDESGNKEPADSSHESDEGSGKTNETMTDKDAEKSDGKKNDKHDEKSTETEKNTETINNTSGNESKQETVTTETFRNEQTTDNVTIINLKNKKRYKKSKKVTIKDNDGIKSIILNSKKIKIGSGKKSFSFKLSKYKKSLKKKNKWNKIIVTDINGNKKTIQFKVK